MAEKSTDENASSEWLERLHHFHLTGELPADHGPPSTDPLRPAAIDPLLEAISSRPGFPLLVPEDPCADGSSVRVLADVVEKALASIESRGRPLVMLRNQIPRLCGLARRRLESLPAGAPAGALMDEAFADLVATFDVSPAGAAALEQEIDELKQALDLEGRLVGLNARTLPFLYTAIVRREVRNGREELAREIEGLARRLRSLLQTADRSDGERKGLAPELGAAGAAFVDTEALARHLSTVRGVARMAPERRSRIENALADLEAASELTEAAPELIVVHGADRLGFEQTQGVELVHAEDPLREAVGRFDAHAAGLVRLLKSVRVARLEVDHAYDPVRHDPILQRLDWQGLAAAELRLLPRVVTPASGETLRGGGFAAFSELLRSGRPVQVLATERVPAGEVARAGPGIHPDLGYLAVAHREAFVVQASLGRPVCLVADLESMVSSVVPAVALIAAPGESELPPGLELEAGLSGRATPCFRYDPTLGASWAERFMLRGNPDNAEVWPTLEWSSSNGTGEGASTHRERFTFAHAACLDPTWRGQFLVLPDDAGFDESQREIADWLVQEPRERRATHPFVWVLGEDGKPGRAALTRTLAFACRDRARAWRILQELGGEENEHARRAANEAREAALAEAAREQTRMAAEHAAALDRAREEGAAEAIDRLVRVLTTPEGLAAATSPAEPIRAEPASPVADAPAPHPVEIEAPGPSDGEDDVDDDEPIRFDEPFIDSFLCTSCNDCINLNPRLFRYNQNKQAELADPTAGSYAELVRAAELCPAHCIHPGKPRAGDSTVTAELIARGTAL